jgi:hypothetical protein
VDFLNVTNMGFSPIDPDILGLKPRSLIIRIPELKLGDPNDEAVIKSTSASKIESSEYSHTF